MNRGVVIAAAMLLTGATSAYAHRLDEYLQATTISVAKDRVTAQIHLTPGVAVFPRILAGIDTNADGVISSAEQRAYAGQVLRDLSLAIDGTRTSLRLTNLKFASVAEMKEGRGDIVIDFDAVVPGSGSDRKLTFENRHLRAISVYLVNALVPKDSAIRVTHQTRDYTQSLYQMDYAQSGVSDGSQSMPAPGPWAWLTLAVALSSVSVVLLSRRRGRTATKITG